MKAVLGWVSDPYVHMILIVLILVRLAMGVGGDTRSDPSQPIVCRFCQDRHDRAFDCRPQVVGISDAERGN